MESPSTGACVVPGRASCAVARVPVPCAGARAVGVVRRRACAGAVRVPCAVAVTRRRALRHGPHRSARGFPGVRGEFRGSGREKSAPNGECRPKTTGRAANPAQTERESRPKPLPEPRASPEPPAARRDPPKSSANPPQTAARAASLARTAGRAPRGLPGVWGEFRRSGREISAPNGESRPKPPTEPRTPPIRAQIPPQNHLPSPKPAQNRRPSANPAPERRCAPDSAAAHRHHESGARSVRRGEPARGTRSERTERASAASPRGSAAPGTMGSYRPWARR